MRTLLGTIICFVALLPIAGCETKVPKGELGTVVFEVPEVPGADKSVELKELDEKKDEKKAVPAK